MDYQHLLFKYMQHICKMEDTLFLELANTPFSKVNFTDEELAVLRSIEEVIENSTSIQDKKQ